MADHLRTFVLAGDAVFRGEVKDAGRVEVLGYIDGTVTADEVIVAEGGRLYGSIASGTADVRGAFQGEAKVRTLFTIRSTGEVSGSIRYGRLAMEEGGALSAKLRNVPPELTGDFNLLVSRGGAVRLTTDDVTAIDPDNTADELSFAVGNAVGGFVALAAAAGKPVAKFTQVELESGKVLFQHDGKSARGSFDLIASDVSGADSGPPQVVTVAVRS